MALVWPKGNFLPPNKTSKIRAVTKTGKDSIVAYFGPECSSGIATGTEQRP